MNVNVERSGKEHIITFNLNGQIISIPVPKGKTSKKEVRKIVYESMGNRERVIPTENTP